MAKVRLPANNWMPRHYQMPFWGYLENGGKRAVEIAHRRYGKDEICLHYAAIAAHTPGQIGNYWHMLPEYAQARKAIWDNVNPHTQRRRIFDAFPPETIETIRENDMFIRFKSGSSWQVVGSDNYKNLVGSAPRGIVFSEWAKAHPGAWPYLSPILAENGGWAAFITTPEGKNHAHAMLEMGRKTPGWYANVATVDDTKAISMETIEEDRSSYIALFGKEMADALIQQEYWCSFAAAVLGAYWGKEIERLENAGNICDLGIVPGFPIHTAWDIGMDDPMAIWVFQVGPGWLHIIDYCEGSGYGFDFYCDWLAERGYVGGNDWVPHDAKQREPGSPGGRTRIQTLIALKRKPVLVPDHKPIDRINAVRRLLGSKNEKKDYRVYMDAERCKAGIDVARNYKADWDEKNRVWRKSAKHDWASHGSDALGHLAVAVDVPRERTATEQQKRARVEARPITVNDLLKQHQPDRSWV